MKKEEMPIGFKLIRAYFVIIIILNLFDLFRGGLQTLTTILLIIIAGVIIFCINKKYKFGQYVIYIATLYSIIYGLVNIITLLTPNTIFNKLQENAVNIPVNDLSKAIYLGLAMLLVDVVINIMIFYYTYKHKDYFIN